MTQSIDKIENIEIIINDKDIKNISLPEYIAPVNLSSTINKWTSEMEDYLEKIGNISLKYKKVHSRKAKYYISKYNTAMYTSIMLGPFVGMLSAINMNLGDVAVIPILILCISFFNGILISIIKFRKWDEGALIHKTSAAKYAVLASSAQRQLTLSEKNREDPDAYMKWITTIFNNTFLTSPIIDSDLESDLETYSNIRHSPEKKSQLENHLLSDYDDKNIDSFYGGIINYEIKRLNNH